MVELTRTEFNLLEAFLSNPGYTFTRDDLLEKAVGFAYEGMGRGLGVGQPGCAAFGLQNGGCPSVDNAGDKIIPAVVVKIEFQARMIGAVAVVNWRGDFFSVKP